MADFIAWEHSVICSDGMLHGRHPRGAGAFAKVLRLYVREQHRLTLEAAVHKMTAQTADQLGLSRRGLIRAGYPADLVLFDPDRITDRSTTEHPEAVAEGVRDVWVNGARVYAQGRATQTYSGRFLRRRAGVE